MCKYTFGIIFSVEFTFEIAKVKSEERETNLVKIEKQRNPQTKETLSLRKCSV